jgi:serine/threonine-protein kinase HipA
MGDQQLNVFMDGVACGVLIQTGSGDLRFRYLDEYRSAPGATPLSVSMPIAVPEHRKRVVLPFLQGLLPDSEPALRSIAADHGVNPRNPFALLRHTGADVAGALQFLPPGEESSDARERGGYQVLDENEVSDLLEDAIDRYREGRSRAPETGRFSLAGAQPKIALLKTAEGSWARPLGATPTTHILKPTSGDWQRLDIVEFLTMRAASLLGLNVAKSEVQVIGGRPCLVVERYDRQLRGGRWHRVHQEDLGQALSVPPDKKYQRGDGGPGVAAVAKLFQDFPVADDWQRASKDFFVGLMFNTLLECTDAHIKNYSILLSGEAVRLAPLYDLATFAPYERLDRRAASAMMIGGQYSYSAMSRKNLLDAAHQLSVAQDAANQVIDHIRNNAVQAFDQARADLHATGQAAAFADQVLEAVSGLPLLTSVD